MKNNHLFLKTISAFAFTSILLLLVYYIGAVYPFGDHALLKWDMELQYADFFHWWHRVLHGEASMTYSLSKSLGDNAIGLTAYYLSSPFNLLLYFTDNIPLFISIVTILKLASASLTSSLFLFYRFQNMKYIWNLLLSISYGLMGYNLCQASNIMWLDGVIWLPILMLGIWKLLSEQKTILLYLSVVFAIICNWYTAYMICLFSFFYFTYEALKKHSFFITQTVKNELFYFITYCITIVSGVLTTMFFFFPVIKNLLQGKGIDTSGSWAIGFHTGLKSIITGSFFLTVPYTGQGLTLFCGTLSLIATFGFFVTHKQTLKAKLWTLGYLLFFILCATFIPLENIWNGFRNVYSYYCRFSFVISFFIIYIAATFLSSFIIRHKQLNRAIISFCMFFTCFESFYGSYQTFVKGYNKSAVAYNNYSTDEKEAVSFIQNQALSLFYRTDQTSSWRTNEKHFFGNFNEGMAYGFMPLSSYSSTYNNNIMSFYNRSGYSSCSRLITWCEPLLTSDSLLGIKYVLGDINCLGFTKANNSSYNNKNIYINPYALGLGFKVSDDSTEIASGQNTFEYQNQLFSKLIGHDIQLFKPCSSSVMHNESGYLWNITAPKSDSIVYGYCTYALGNELDLYVDDTLRTFYSEWSSYKTFQVTSNNTRNHIVELRGTLNRNQEIEGVFYYLDMTEFQKAMSYLSAKQVNVLKFNDGYIKCDYSASQNDLVLFTIPYDEGWNVYVNNQKVKPHILQNIFIGVDIPSGQNIIEFKFSLPGLKTGIAFSCFGICIYFAMLLFIKFHKR